MDCTGISVPSPQFSLTAVNSWVKHEGDNWSFPIAHIDDFTITISDATDTTSNENNVCGSIIYAKYFGDIGTDFLDLSGSLITVKTDQTDGKAESVRYIAMNDYEVYALDIQTFKWVNCLNSAPVAATSGWDGFYAETWMIVGGDEVPAAFYWSVPEFLFEGYYDVCKSNEYKFEC